MKISVVQDKTDKVSIYYPVIIRSSSGRWAVRLDEDGNAIGFDNGEKFNSNNIHWSVFTGTIDVFPNIKY